MKPWNWVERPEMLWNCECVLKRLELLQDLPSRPNKLLVSFESPCSGWKGPGQWAYAGDVYHRWRNTCENIPLSQSVGGKNPWFSRWWDYFMYQNYCWEIFPVVLYSPDPIVYQYLLVTLWSINIDPENHPFLMETNLPTPICQGQTVNLPEGTSSM